MFLYYAGDNEHLCWLEVLILIRVDVPACHRNLSVNRVDFLIEKCPESKFPCVHKCHFWTSISVRLNTGTTIHRQAACGHSRWPYGTSGLIKTWFQILKCAYALSGFVCTVYGGFVSILLTLLPCSQMTSVQEFHKAKKKKKYQEFTKYFCPNWILPKCWTQYIVCTEQVLQQCKNIYIQRKIYTYKEIENACIIVLPFYLHCG